MSSQDNIINELENVESPGDLAIIIDYVNRLEEPLLTKEQYESIYMEFRGDDEQESVMFNYRDYYRRVSISEESSGRNYSQNYDDVIQSINEIQEDFEDDFI